jgi:hypothetical protein
MPELAQPLAWMMPTSKATLPLPEHSLLHLQMLSPQAARHILLELHALVQQLPSIQQLVPR